MRAIILAGSLLFVSGTAVAGISDEAMVSTCMSDVEANMALPPGTSVEIMRPSCDCVADTASNEEVRQNLLDYTASDPADRTFMLTMAAREILWDCFHVPEEHRIVPEGAEAAAG